MADRVISILTPATSFGLLTLEEAKLALGMSITDASEDQQLSFWNEMNSQTVMRMCNRIFAREEVREEWRELNGGWRIFPSHWPIKQADLISVESPMGTALDPSNYELEEQSGKIEFFGGMNGSGSSAWVEPVVVHYWGGYVLPDNAPFPLKRATSMLNVQSKMLGTLGTVGGLRSLSHKESRIQYHDPSRILAMAMGGPAGGIDRAIWSILSHYVHFEV